MLSDVDQVMRLLAAAPKMVSRQKPKPIQIRIPADHPRVDRLVALFKKLSTGARLRSGIIITGGSVSDQAVRIFLNELEIFLAEDGIDLKQVMVPFLKQDEPALDLEALMQRILRLTGGRTGGLLRGSHDVA